MILTKDKGQRMWGGGFGNGSGGSGGSGGEGGGGGVTLGPLLTSLNAEAMPAAEGYLHWTGSDWDFTSIDLSSYATEAWVLQQGYVTSSAISDMATETWVLQQGYITESAVSNAWKVKDVQVVDDNSVVVNGEDVIYGAVLASNGMLTLNRTRLSIYVPEYTSDLVNDSGFIDQTTADGRYLQLATGGTVNGNLNVKGTIQAQDSNGNNKVIIYGNTGNIRAEKVYIGGSTSGYEAATHDWVTSQGYQANVIETVKVAGTTLTPTNKAVDIPAATSDGSTFGVVAIGTGFAFDEGRLCVDTSTFATRTWADGRYLPLTGGSLSNDLTIASNKYLRFGSNSGGLLIHNTTNGNNSLDISANRINLNVENGLFCNGEEVSTHSAIQNEFVAKAGSSMTGALSMGNGVNVNFGDCSVTSNGSAQGNIQAGKILKLMGNYVAITAGDNADANFTVNGNIVATRTWVTTQLGSMVTALGVSGDNLTWTAGGQTNNVTVPFATDSKTLRNFFDSRPESANNQYGDGKLRHYMATSSMTTGKPPVDAHIIHSAWDNTGGWDAQLAIGNENSGLYYRTQSQGTWQAWKQVAIIDNLNTLGDNLQTYVNTQLGGYLPLTAGSSKPLTGNIAYKGTKATYDMITFIDNVGDIYGNGIAIGGGGATIIGGGESAGTMSAQVSGGSEVMYIGNDQGVSIYTNLQDGWSYGKKFDFTTGGNLFLPKRSDNGCLWLSSLGSMNFNAGTGGWAAQFMALNNSTAANLGGCGMLGENNSLTYFYIGQAHNNTWVVVKPDGNVGIGTTTPQAKLHVNGNVRISGTLTGVTNIDGLMIFDSTNNKVTVGTLDVTNLGMTSISVGESGYKMSISSNDNAVTFDVEDVGDYVFGYGNSRGNIYAGDGDFTGNVGIGTAATSSYKLKVQGASLLNGLVGIGTTPVQGHALDVDGDVYVSGDVIANNVPRGSDIRMKNVRRYLEPSVRDVAFAPIIEFDWKDGFGGQNASHSVGSIAQYWQTVFPQAVREGKDGMLCLEYGAVALASAITAARHSLDNERRIAELELRVAELEDELAAMVSQHSETTDN